MRDPIILLVYLIATLARLMGPGGLRSVVAESVLVKQLPWCTTPLRAESLP